MKLKQWKMISAFYKHSGFLFKRKLSFDFQEALNGKPVDWLEKVSDEQYQDRFKTE
ncbi:hypothetical protein [Nostoc sp. TCL240-02]|uniref:hypothetical protein n=1 Tax=Nostoc sp. TCL240-02 TaxID=2572090 RepID=UPI00157F991D|nr:hypothetical protein [Nostoc sp. TCL240-02]